MRRKKRSTLCHCQVFLCFDRTPPAPMGLNLAVEQHFCSHSYFKPLMGLEKLGARSEIRQRFWEGNPSIHSYIWTNWCCRSNHGMLEGTLKISVVGGGGAWRTCWFCTGRQESFRNYLHSSFCPGSIQELPAARDGVHTAACKDLLEPWGDRLALSQAQINIWYIAESFPFLLTALMSQLPAIPKKYCFLKSQ